MATPESGTPGRGEQRGRSPVVHKSPNLFGKSPNYAAFNANDDELERQQIRAAKAAAQRKALLSDLQAAAQPPLARESRELSGNRLMSLFQNCTKLASENKINQKNTWDLELIDHITHIVKADSKENNSQTNFQKASCTLEAGVKIYSYRVDSIHSETFRVLNGLNRTSMQDEAEADQAEDGSIPAAKDQSEAWKKGSLSTTLEASFDAINLKKFDAAYAVDPLFHQTSAQFDEGGARGLLLYNLGISQDLRIMFDSVEAEDSTSRAGAADAGKEVDLTEFADQVDTIMRAVESQAEITPSLEEVFSMTHDPRRAAFQGRVQLPDPSAAEAMPSPGEEVARDAPPEADEGVAMEPPQGLDEGGPAGGWGMDGDDGFHDDGLEGPGGEGGGAEWAPAQGEDLVLQPTAADWLLLSMGLPLAKEKAWAGPKHWQFTTKSEDPAAKADKARARKSSDKAEFLDFSRRSEVDWSLLRKAGKPRDINLLRVSDRSSNTRFLPPKHEFDLGSQARLFLKPSYGLHSMVAKGSAAGGQPAFGFNNSPGFQQNLDDDDGPGDFFSAENSPASAWGAADDDDLVLKPKQVEKVEVTYAKRSKQVDVKALKDTIWGLMGELAEEADGAGGEISMKATLQRIPRTCPAAPIEDISVHLCFISLLHLANENSLTLKAPKTMDEVVVSDFPA